MRNNVDVELDDVGYVVSELFEPDYSGLYPKIDPIEIVDASLITDYFPFGSKKRKTFKQAHAASDVKSTSLIHFYTDDVRFELLYHTQRSLSEYYDFAYVIGTDFSLLPYHYYPIQIFNVFRNRLMCARFQSDGYTVIPSVSWGDLTTFPFCFDGLPQDSVLSIKCSHNVPTSSYMELWAAGFEQMLKLLTPKQLFICGELPAVYDFLRRDLSIVEFDGFMQSKRKSLSASFSSKKG